MPGIEQSPCSLAFRVDSDSFGADDLATSSPEARIRTRARALAGMQKEAIVQYSPTGEIWRVVCDEGPWLNGTDLAPFPLAFFTAGLAASFLSEYMAEALQRTIPITALEIHLDNFFTMEGSALKGTMAAHADPVQVRFVAEGDASALEFANIGEVAVHERSVANAALREALASTFAIIFNGQNVSKVNNETVPLFDTGDPRELFDRCMPDSKFPAVDNILRKVASDTETSAISDPVGLQPTQKRTVHVATRGHVRQDGLKEISVQCIQPAGSRFVFLSDDSEDAGGQGRAPNGITWLSCGVAFCFMTQIGRYAAIAKQKLNDYRIVQDTGFVPFGDRAPSASPVKTLVCLDMAESVNACEHLVKMGEQTCYLHAAYRKSTEIRVC